MVAAPETAPQAAQRKAAPKSKSPFGKSGQHCLAVASWVAVHVAPRSHKAPRPISGSGARGARVWLPRQKLPASAYVAGSGSAGIAACGA